MARAEIRLLRPRALVLLGATAAQAILGASFRVSRDRGQFVEAEGMPPSLATLHPRAVLRAGTPEQRRAQRGVLVSDLRTVAQRIAR